MLATVGSWVSTYLGHPLDGLGYQFWSGIEASVEHWIQLGLIGAVWWRHHNCIHHGCWRKGHSDPEHGHPVCPKHQDKLLRKDA